MPVELAEEGQVHAAGHVGRGQERSDQADVQEGVVAGLPGGDEDLVLRPEPGEREDARQRERADDEGPERHRHVLCEPAHVPLHVEAVMHRVTADRPRTEEEKRLEERVREQVEERRHVHAPTPSAITM